MKYFIHRNVNAQGLGQLPCSPHTKDSHERIKFHDSTLCGASIKSLHGDWDELLKVLIKV
jgi:hypothetical protein